MVDQAIEELLEVPAGEHPRRLDTWTLCGEAQTRRTRGFSDFAGATVLGDLGSAVCDHRNTVLKGFEGQRSRPVWRQSGVVEPDIEISIRKCRGREASGDSAELGRFAASSNVNHGSAAQAARRQSLGSW